MGIFPRRGKDTPNQIEMTSVKITSTYDEVLNIQGLDAVNDTPILDIKPYYQVYACKAESIVLEWVNTLMKHYF